MLSTRRFRPGGFGRAAPPRGEAGAGRLVLLALVLAALGLEGCSSFRNPCDPSPCGGSRPFGRCRNPFRRDVIVTDPCGEPALGAPVVAEPAPAATGVAPGPPVELEPVIPTPAPAEELSPAPSTSPAPRSGQSGPAQKTLYETSRPGGGTTTSRRNGLRPRSGGATGSAGLSLSAPLVDLPPVAAAVAAPADEVTAPAAPPAPVPSASPAVPGELPPKPAASGPASVAEGIARFKVVDPLLAAGSLPTEAGWKFLAEEKGYHTVIDLRPRTEVQPGDDAAIHHYGLRYVVLPLTPETLDDTLLRRFEDEIQLAGARPLYVFDNTGARPAILWYLHLILVGKEDEATAKREVEELGPIDNRLWLAATALLERKKAPPAGPPQPQPAPAVAPVAPQPQPQPAPTPKPDAPPLPQPAPAAAPAAGPTPAPGPSASNPPAASAPQPEPASPPAASAPVAAACSGPTSNDTDARDPGAWKSYAAMAVVGLGIPLAYIGRTAISYRGSRRASLPAPVPESQAFPGASDE